MTTLVLQWGVIGLTPQLFNTLYLTVIKEVIRLRAADAGGWATLSEFLRLTPTDSMAALLVEVMMLSILVASIVFWLSVPARMFI